MRLTRPQGMVPIRPINWPGAIYCATGFVAIQAAITTDKIGWLPRNRIHRQTPLILVLRQRTVPPPTLTSVAFERDLSRS